MSKNKNEKTRMFAALLIISIGSIVFWFYSCSNNSDKPYPDGRELSSPTVYSSIELGTDSSIHILANKFLGIYKVTPFYAVKTNGTWFYENILTQNMEKYSTQTTVHALALDKQNTPHICMTIEDQAYYATKKTGEWVYTKLINRRPYGQMGIAVDSNNHAHVSIPVNEDGLYYATNQSGYWKSVKLLDSGEGGQILFNAPIGIDSNDKIHICYGSRRVLFYFTNQSGFWKTEKIYKQATLTALLLDPDDYVNILYADDRLQDNRLGHASNKSGTWEAKSTAIEPEGLGSLMIDAKWDPDGSISVFYQSYWSPDRIYFATNASGDWEMGPVDNLGGYSFSMAIDSLGAYQLVAYSNFRAYYATNATGQWELEELEPIK